MSPTIVIDCVDFCKALADETRQAILRMLLQGEMCVSDIVDALACRNPLSPITWVSSRAWAW